MTNAKITPNAIQVLQENFNAAEDHEASLKEYVELSAENDPKFFNWLFPNAENINDFGAGMTVDQKESWNQLLFDIDSDPEDYINFLISAIVTDRQIQNQYPEHYRLFTQIETAIHQAWESWDEETVKTYWEENHDSKPTAPTDEFSTAWIENEDFEADGFNIEVLEELAR